MQSRLIPPSWSQQGLCSQLEGDAWFSTQPGQIKQAQEACLLHCPMLEDCRSYTATIRPVAGVWAGEDYNPPLAAVEADRRCAGCRQWYAQRAPHQIYCTARCRNTTGARARRARQAAA